MSTATVTVEAPVRRASAPKPAPLPRNGVDTPALLATIGVVRDQPQLAQFQFRARSEWVSGTHSRTTMETFSGAGGEHSHVRAYAGDGDHPAVLCGSDAGPTPVEWLLTALASCLMAGIGNIAAVRGVNLQRVEAHLEGDIDLRGILGLSDEVRNGYQALRVRFEIEGDAPAPKLREIVEQARNRSAVFDIITNGIPVAIDVQTGR
jgi:uncharacterized OsmC-like protein